MRLAIHFPMHGRLDLAEIVLRQLDRVRDAVKPAIDLRIVASVSELEAYSLADAYADDSIEWPNAPVGRKHNRLLLECRACEPDAVMHVGSDDLVHEDLVRRWAQLVGEGEEYVGLIDMFFWDLPWDRFAHFTGYPPPRIGEPLGACRCWSRALL